MSQFALLAANVCNDSALVSLLRFSLFAQLADIVEILRQNQFALRHDSSRQGKGKPQEGRSFSMLFHVIILFAECTDALRDGFRLS